ncbi:MAG: hypothetical protein ACSHX3_03565 [Litorimonas sp.]
MAMNKTRISLADLANMEEAEVIDYLLELSVELSEIALEAGKPKASALMTLAASNLRTGTGRA